MSADDMLSQWHNGIRILQIGHLRAAARYHLRHKWLGIPATILSIVVGTSVFASLSSPKDHSAVGIGVGLVSVMVAVLTGLQTFLNYPDLASKHQLAGVKYGSLRRRVEALAGPSRPVLLLSAGSAFRQTLTNTKDLVVFMHSSGPRVHLRQANCQQWCQTFQCCCGVRA